MTGSTVFMVELEALQKLLADKDTRIERLRSLLISAADALELAISHYGSKYEEDLIDQLRKAAE